MFLPPPDIKEINKVLALLDSNFVKNKDFLDKIDHNISNDPSVNLTIMFVSKSPILASVPVVFMHSLEKITDKADYVFLIPYVDLNSNDTEIMKKVINELNFLIQNFNVKEVDIPLTSHNSDFNEVLSNTISSAKINVNYIN
ncbi:MAG: hypothetical protein QXF12_02870 [Candidatus Aenigmatarchaeota archaeon]